jgi:hypothetical protein
MSQTRKRKEFLMSDSSDPDAIPFILQTRCEMAAWVYLRPITWRLELVDINAGEDLHRNGRR